MKIIMLTLLVVLAYLSDVYGLFAVHNLVYTDCNSSPRKLVHVTEQSAHLSPYPVVIPGDIRASVSGQVLKPISGHNVRMKLNIQKQLLGRYQKVPCLANVGSCEYDVCDLIGKISDADCANYLKPNHIPCRCPIPEGTYTLSPHTFQIPEATGAWSWIASGVYAIDVRAVDNTTNEEIACYHVEVELKSKSSGFFCG